MIIDAISQKMLIELGVIAFVSYIIGSVPTGYLVVKLIKNEDIRNIGSGSTGATNVKRVLGKEWFFAVMLLDAFKGFLPVFVAANVSYAFYEWGIPAVVAAIFVLLGHSKSVFLKFTGGKCVASGVGTIIALCWPVGLITAAIWGVITYFSKYVSLGSIIALTCTPILMTLFKQPPFYVSYCAIGAAYVIYLHRENVKRLFDGTESKVR
ncbi:MAG: glycerol-3-phosphate 1-O-acyltransferase PlsY [Candidatus Gastranaerophilales bacterium]|nr:glycerol-3-phosphate 1-O-acyltransferase PlsY [Candidatus Gastranaerophilales bacterium]